MICSSSCSVTDRAGGRRSGIGSGPGTIRTPWWIGGRKLLSQTWVPAYGMCSQSTTYDGKAGLNVPRP